MTKEDETEMEVNFQKEVFNWMLDVTRQQSVIIESLVEMSQDLKAANEKLSNAGK